MNMNFLITIQIGMIILSGLIWVYAGMSKEEIKESLRYRYSKDGLLEAISNILEFMLVMMIFVILLTAGAMFDDSHYYDQRGWRVKYLLLIFIFEILFVVFAHKFIIFVANRKNNKPKKGKI